MLVLAGCGDDRVGDTPADSTTAPQRTKAPKPQRKPRAKRIRSARCPPGAANCSAAVGTVLYIESVDADGDGDLHVVATHLRGDAVTGGGIVVFDVNKFLRPKRDPDVGDLVTGAGPVFKGSFGQRQIQVTEFRVVRGTAR